jgi:anti-sigma B factor antagonist
LTVEISGQAHTNGIGSNALWLDGAVTAKAWGVSRQAAPEFKEVLVTGIEGGAKRVIVDLSGVTFIDSTALGVLVSGAKRVRPRNGNLDIVCTDENIIRIFEITGLDRIFGIFSSRGEALKAASV